MHYKKDKGAKRLILFLAGFTTLAVQPEQKLL